MALTDEEFRAWCQRNKIEPETITYIQRIRSSEPERKVRGGASNVSGRYPSQKMGFSIQFESQHVELWGCYTMERDNDVLEMYDQPTRIQLHYHARSGRKTSPWHTPDFLVLRRDGAGFEEWKKASSLEKLVETMPGRYQRQASGGWRCPPGERAAQALGLSYRVRTSAEYHPLYIENLKFLQDFWTHPFHLEAEQEAQVLQALSSYHRAEAEHGCGYFGLLDKVQRRGNRKARVPDASRQLLSEYLTAHYAVPQAKRAAAVYRLYREECTKQGIPPVGERTFYRERASFEDQEVTTRRRGKRAAYASQPFFYALDQTTPRYGGRPFARAHLDHTELDIVRVSSVTGKPNDGPWKKRSGKSLEERESEVGGSCLRQFSPRNCISLGFGLTLSSAPA